MRELGAKRDEVRGIAHECAPWTKSLVVTAALRERLPDADAIVALGRIGDCASADCFEATAREPANDRDVRTDAVWSLAAVRGSAASPLLERLAVVDGDAVVQEAATRALALMGVETVSQPVAETSRQAP